VSDPNYNRDQLINTNFEAIRHLRADHDALKARVEQLEKQIAEILKGQSTNGN